jgi:hypothetical protein
MKIEIKRIDDIHGIAPTYWMVCKDDMNVSACYTFRKAWNCAKAVGGTKETIILDPIDK